MPEVFDPLNSEMYCTVLMLFLLILVFIYLSLCILHYLIIFHVFYC